MNTIRLRLRMDDANSPQPSFFLFILQAQIYNIFIATIKLTIA